jgi:hypothetical protein
MKLKKILALVVILTPFVILITKIAADFGLVRAAITIGILAGAVVYALLLTWLLVSD